MNYYEHHLGDYAKDTGHLTMLEHGAYRILLDRYYSTEQGIPADQAYRLARARSEEECRAVDVVLDEFFELIDGVWIQHRVEREIAQARKRITAAQENGKKGGRPRKKPEGMETETQEKPNGLLPGSDSETQPKAHQAPSTYLPIGSKEAASIPPTESREARSDAADLSDPIQSRVVEIVHLLRQRGAALQTGDPRIRSWAEQGASDAQLLQALEIADERRATARNPSPVNAGYLDSILADVRAGPARGKRPTTKGQRVSDWMHEAAESVRDSARPKEIDMGVIDASDS